MDTIPMNGRMPVTRNVSMPKGGGHSVQRKVSVGGRSDRSNVYDPCVSWAMLSHRSIDNSMYRDWMLVPGGIEEPTGRLTSVDPRFPTICEKDGEIYAHGNVETPVSRFASEREVAYSMMIDENVELGQMVDATPKVRGLTIGGEYKEDEEDLLDQHLAYCLRQSTKKHDVERKRPGVYQIDGREICLEWRRRFPAEAGYLIICDGPMKQRCQDYLDGIDETAEYEEYGMNEPNGKISNVRNEDRLSFGDSAYQSYTRLEAMRVAKEQAKLRESAAEKYVKTGLMTYRSKEEHMDKNGWISWEHAAARDEMEKEQEAMRERYRAWHKAQLQVEPPYFQWDDIVQEREMSPKAPRAPSPPAVPFDMRAEHSNNMLTRDATLAPPGGAPVFGQPSLPIPQLQIPGLFPQNPTNPPPMALY